MRSHAKIQVPLGLASASREKRSSSTARKDMCPTCIATCMAGYKSFQKSLIEEHGRTFGSSGNIMSEQTGPVHKVHPTKADALEGSMALA